MKKTVAISLILLGLSLTSTEALAALELTWPNSPLGTQLNENTDIASLVKYLYEWGVSLGGFAAFIVLVMAGIQYLSSVGDPGKMKSARDRIKDAALGLVLLLGSVLILNTINPQLTKLKVPQFPTDPGKWELGFKLKPEKQGGNCQYVKLCEDVDRTDNGKIDCNTLIAQLKPGEAKDPLNRTVGSIDFEGNCQLALYRLTGFRTNADNPPLTVSGDISDTNLYGVTYFGSAKVTNFQY